LPDQISSQTRRNNSVQPRSVDVDLIGGHTVLLNDRRLVVLLLNGDVVLDPLVAPGESAVATVSTPGARICLYQREQQFTGGGAVLEAYVEGSIVKRGNSEIGVKVDTL